jgi:hypothetical protein
LSILRYAESPARCKRVPDQPRYIKEHIEGVGAEAASLRSPAKTVLPKGSRDGLVHPVCLGGGWRPVAAHVRLCHD